MKETDDNLSRWQSFQLKFNSSAKLIVCNQLNFNCKIFVFSRISAEFFSSHPYFFRLQVGGLLIVQKWKSAHDAVGSSNDCWRPSAL